MTKFKGAHSDVSLSSGPMAVRVHPWALWGRCTVDRPEHLELSIGVGVARNGTSLRWITISHTPAHSPDQEDVVFEDPSRDPSEVTGAQSRMRL